MKQYLLISRLKIHNANAMSSQYTIGFPAMMGWLGAVHALQRQLHSHGFSRIRLPRVAVSCHNCDVQLYRGPHDYKNSVIGTANPLKKSKKTGNYERPPFIEEARCHLSVTLLIEIEGYDPDTEDELLEVIHRQLPGLKICGGDIENNVEQMHIQIEVIDENDKCDQRALRRKLMPGYVVIERKDLMEAAKGNGDALDQLLSCLCVRHSADPDKDGKIKQWIGRRDGSEGWIVPLAVGFNDITGAIKAAYQRDERYEHHFVEPIVTLGEFIMPYRFDSVEAMMWQYRYDRENGLYLCECS